MYKKELKIGEQFGEWTVLEQINERKNGYIVYKVRCSCGYETNLAGHYLRSKKSEYCRSCSAIKRIPKKENNKFYKHGGALKNSPLRSTYKTWISMRQRCIDENCRDYKNYGGRGIKVCDEWNSFEVFLQDMGIRPENLSLDRINNDSDYCKENCRWTTRDIQNNNRRDNTFFMINGIRITRSEIQKKLNWTRDQYRRRKEKYGIDWILNEYKKASIE